MEENGVRCFSGLAAVALLNPVVAADCGPNIMEGAVPQNAIPQECKGRAPTLPQSCTPLLSLHQQTGLIQNCTVLRFVLFFWGDPE